MKITISVWIAVFLLLLSSCTSDSGGSRAKSLLPSITQPIKEIVDDIIGDDVPEVAETQKLVDQIQKDANQDPVFQITNEDQAFLESVNLLDDPTEISGWVK